MYFQTWACSKVASHIRISKRDEARTGKIPSILIVCSHVELCKLIYVDCTVIQSLRDIHLIHFATLFVISTERLLTSPVNLPVSSNKIHFRFFFVTENHFKISICPDSAQFWLNELKLLRKTFIQIFSQLERIQFK